MAGLQVLAGENNKDKHAIGKSGSGGSDAFGDRLQSLSEELSSLQAIVEVNSGTGALLPLSLGNLFELKADDSENAFETWAEIPATDNDFDDRVLKQFKELADSASESATTATNAANSAEEIVTTVVEEKGKELDTKEAAALANIQTLLESGQLLISQQIVDGNNALVITINNGKDELNNIANTVKESEINAKNSETESKKIYDNLNTKIIQDVEDSDEKLASSGAVYRELQNKQDSLEFFGTGATVNKSELDKKRDSTNAVFINTLSNGCPQLRLRSYNLSSAIGTQIYIQGDGGVGMQFRVGNDAWPSAYTLNMPVLAAYATNTLATQEWVNGKLSDMRAKKDIKLISDAEIEVMGNINFQSFRYREEQQYTNENAIFFGVIAQKVVNAFKAAGLNAFDYNIAVNLDYKNKNSGDTLNRIIGISYIDLLVLEAEVNRRLRKKLEDRILNIEKKLDQLL